MKIRKIFLIFAIVALLSVVFVTAISASEYDFIVSGDETEITESHHLSSQFFKFEFSSDYYISFVFLEDYENDVVYVRPADFKKALTFINGSASLSYQDFLMMIANLSINYPDNFSSGTLLLFDFFASNENGCDEAFFNKLYYYDEITEADLDELQAQ